MPTSNNKSAGTNKAVVLFSVVFLFMLVTVLFSLYLSAIWPRMAKALNGNYNRVAGNEALTMDDWNYLDEDFVKKEGDVMTGTLNMGSNNILGLPATPMANDAAASKAYVDSIVSGGINPIENTAGTAMRMVCGKTSDTDWYSDPAPNTIGVTVNLAPFGFGATPQIFTSLGGTNNHFEAIGGANIYSASPTGFTVFVTHLTKPLSPVIADNWNWYLNWCAVAP